MALVKSLSGAKIVLVAFLSRAISVLLKATRIPKPDGFFYPVSCIEAFLPKIHFGEIISGRKTLTLMLAKLFWLPEVANWLKIDQNIATHCVVLVLKMTLLAVFKTVRLKSKKRTLQCFDEFLVFGSFLKICEYPKPGFVKPTRPKTRKKCTQDSPIWYILSGWC